MFIAIKDSKLIAIHETEWQCRRRAKKLSKPQYWSWLSTVTSVDSEGNKTYDFSGEDYEIIKTDAPFSYQDKDSNGDDITVNFNSSDYIQRGNYFLKWDGSKIVKDDDALTTYQTAEKWKRVRADRNRRLAETDYLALNDQNLSAEMTTYRQALRDITTQTDPDNITWPEKP